MATRKELVAAISDRYVSSSRSEKGQILDEFIAVTQMHRKHVGRLLRQGNSRKSLNVRSDAVFTIRLSEKL
jgi:hypothetical protein